MSIRDEWIVLDTNIWIFGQRRVQGFTECAELLNFLNRLRVVLPRQILQELQANFSDKSVTIPVETVGQAYWKSCGRVGLNISNL